MLPAWCSYIRKLCWRYPNIHPLEKAAIEAVTAPELIKISYFSKRLPYEEAVIKLGYSKAQAKTIEEDYFFSVAKELNLPGADRDE